MVVESLQCPKCGSPVDVTQGVMSVVCSYCASSLRVTRGSSGHPVGALDDIRADTSFIAKERQLNHVLARRDALRAERDALQEMADSALAKALEAAVTKRKMNRHSKFAAVCLVVMLVSCIVGIVAISVDGDTLILLSVLAFVVAAASLLMFRPEVSRDQRDVMRATIKDEVSREYEPGLAELEPEIGIAQDRAAQLQRDLHDLAMGI